MLGLSVRLIRRRAGNVNENAPARFDRGKVMPSKRVGADLATISNDSFTKT